MIRTVVGLVAAAALMIVGAAQTPAPPIDLRTIGPQVGTTVPSFTLPDQEGRLRTLESLLGPKGAILVFFRSADW